MLPQPWSVPRGILHSTLWRRRLLYAVMRLSSSKVSHRHLVSEAEDLSLARTRNLGIMAHIDAGKTTTTERMLFYAGETRYIGNVDDGNTQMDHLHEERERGITIVAAATTLRWQGHVLNLIDTPGHVDFTLEVERALRVLDGAIAVLDGVAGVQTQTKTVFRQAHKFGIPIIDPLEVPANLNMLIGFVNKMDRPGADYAKTCQSVVSKLELPVMQLHQPIFSPASEYTGVIDLVDWMQHEWDDATSSTGNEYTSTLITTPSAPLLAHRGRLVETVADLDDTLAELVLSEDEFDFAQTPSAELKAAIRRVTLAGKAVPMLAGSARRNKGVQLLLTAVNDFFPSPLERPPVQLEDAPTDMQLLAPDRHGPLCALAFKVVFHPQRGPLVFLRVYSGTLSVRDTIFNSTKQTKERVTRLLRVHADHFTEISEVHAGDIIAAVGLKNTYTGDTLVNSNLGLLKRARLAGVDIPPPVFACSIEGDYAAKQKEYDEALECLQKEDPSLRVYMDEETGQQILSGMGALHLEVAISRLRTQYGVVCQAGPKLVAYKECPITEGSLTYTLQRPINQVIQDISAKVSVRLRPGLGRAAFSWPSGAASVTETESSATVDVAEASEALREAVQRAVLESLSRGPSQHHPVVDTEIVLESLIREPSATTQGVIVCVTSAVQKLLHNIGTKVLEPWMSLEVFASNDHTGAILGDISSRRRGNVLNVEGTSDGSIIYADVPLDTMLEYDSILRNISAGSASFCMKYNRLAVKQC